MMITKTTSNPLLNQAPLHRTSSCTTPLKRLYGWRAAQWRSSLSDWQWTLYCTAVLSAQRLAVAHIRQECTSLNNHLSPLPLRSALRGRLVPISPHRSMLPTPRKIARGLPMNKPTPGHQHRGKSSTTAHPGQCRISYLSRRGAHPNKEYHTSHQLNSIRRPQ
ncbi:hypothetical protein Pmar_PMAR023716 [Perkinsus marinus ATCC 50983]|uniref:Uncharacterized protein n=1 Tax=Perkinsus marinus (strain ATCC 50983 / TXsc) TaxID=423536 RepID=C5KD38_PERM5|nr:hypothetical protein Pmar_PMAR023716 [Perkinsus marinus ATCC 50983]EER17787.1 hypothetical protein Pmar_PMAR023716 [Perkinsus marinus ATCC 50983]|eukprot:XP_002785991.1 hypothetical protein Pmar_PMAR023716 [Perkinsus marinus ATCC 50983]